MSARADELAPGTRLGPYVIEGTIGSGGRLLEMTTVNGGIELKKGGGV